MFAPSGSEKLGGNCWWVNSPSPSRVEVISVFEGEPTYLSLKWKGHPTIKHDLNTFWLQPIKLEEEIMKRDLNRFIVHQIQLPCKPSNGTSIPSFKNKLEFSTALMELHGKVLPRLQLRNGWLVFHTKTRNNGDRKFGILVSSQALNYVDALSPSYPCINDEWRKEQEN